MLGIGGDAAADRHVQLVVGVIHAQRERLDSQAGVLGDGAGLRGGVTGQQDAELLAAEAGRHTARRADLGQHVGDVPDEAIPRQMAAAVVDVPEVVEVEHDDRQVLPVAHGVVDGVVEQ